MNRKGLLKLTPLYYVLFFLAALFHRAWYRRWKVVGRENLPSGKPIIFAANHQNALMDALAILFAYRRQTVFLARADIFRKKTNARMLRFLRILPVYRIRDGFGSLGQNQETFGEVNQVLRQKIPVGMFPEGSHVGQKTLRPLRKGLARMALHAEELEGFKLDLHIVPVALDYSDYFSAGADLMLIFGKPICVADYKNQYIDNQAIAFNSLRNDLSVAMREAIIAGMKSRMESRMESRIFRHLFLIFLFPLFLYGSILNFIPYFLAKAAARKVRDPHLAVSVKFVVGFILYPIWYMALVTIFCFLFHNQFVVAGLIISLPVSALVALYYFKRLSTAISKQE